MPGQLADLETGRARLAHAETTLLPAVRAAMRRYLAVARAAVLDHDTTQVTAAPGDVDPDQLPPNLDAWPPRAVWERAVAEHILPAGERVFRETWDDQLAPDEHAAVPEEADEFGEYLTETAARLNAAAWPDDVYDQLRTLVVDSLRAGEPLSTLRAQVAGLLDLDRWGSRAQFIARNETLNALNAGQHAAGLTRADLFGERLFKRWLAVPDTSTREAHRLANGTTVEPLATFDVGGEQLRYPHDPRSSISNTANCRCLLLWVDEHELAAAENPNRDGQPVAAAPTTHQEGTAVDGTTIDPDVDVWGLPTDDDVAAWEQQETDPPAPPAPETGGAVAAAADFTPSGAPTAAKRQRAENSGHALPGGRYPIENGSDLGKAINAVTLAKGGEAGRRLVRRHIMRQAKRLGLTSKIPATWNADGSIKPASTSSRPMAAAYADPISAESWAERVAANVPAEPDPDAFRVPPGPRGMKLQVVDDQKGIVAGYLWDWDSRHRVHDIPPPRDPHGGTYPQFRRHPVRTADGGRVPTGPITTNGHGDRGNVDIWSVIAHYDDPRYVAANAVVTDAEYGGWASGALRAGVAPWQVAFLDTYSQSGHWMNDELVASCCVSVPAFELPPQVALAAAASDARVEDAVQHAIYDDAGRCLSLTGAGFVIPERPAQLVASVDAWQFLRELRACEADDQAVQAAARRMHADPLVDDAATRMRKGA